MAVVLRNKAYELNDADMCAETFDLPPSKMVDVLFLRFGFEVKKLADIYRTRSFIAFQTEEIDSLPVVWLGGFLRFGVLILQ